MSVPSDSKSTPTNPIESDPNATVLPSDASYHIASGVLRTINKEIESVKRKRDVPSESLREANNTLATRKRRERELQQVADKANKELSDQRVKTKEAQSMVSKIEKEDKKEYDKEMEELVERQGPAYKKLRKIEDRMHGDIVTLRFKKAKIPLDPSEDSDSDVGSDEKEWPAIIARRAGKVQASPAAGASPSIVAPKRIRKEGKQSLAKRGKQSLAYRDSSEEKFEEKGLKHRELDE